METEMAADRLEGLFRELAAVRAENSALRANLTRNRRYSVLLRRAVVDAHVIILAAWSDEATGQLSMQRAHGMTRRRWEWAVAFLRYAQVVATGGDWRSGLEFLETELDRVVEKLEQAATILDSVPNGYKRLRALLRR